MRETQATHNRIPGRADSTDARASEFIMRRYDRSDWTDADQAELNTWLEESLANRAAYWRLKAAWTRADRLDALRSVSVPEIAAADAPQRLRPGVKFAAAFAFLAFVGGGAWFANEPATQTISTKIGERRSLQLADGSHVELTTNTTIRVAANGARRKVWLDKGEAFFRVVHDEKRPFEIQASGFRVVDLGTEFAVRRDADRIAITVLKGSVSVEPSDHAGKSIRLVAGDTARASNDTVAVSKKSAAEVADALSWRTGILVFRRAPLSAVAAEFNRYNAMQVVIDEQAVSNMTVSARLPADDVSVFARMAQNFMGLQVRRLGGEIHISR
jgi:transmembrane sensor